MATVLRPIDPAEGIHAELDGWIKSTRGKSLLRFITCGSVDDGKSTLIGRLLYDSKLLLEDQLTALADDSRKYGTQGLSLDFALLVDGLLAEREQGITIDVAYRFFTTERRKFIVADTPGHEQYTRNMATGASTADLAIILVDARKGILTQTRRHTLLARLLGIRHLLLAVNKMDLVGYDEEVFRRHVADYERFAAEAGIGDFTAIPLSGFTGDNVTVRSPKMPWFTGAPLLEHLEMVPAEPADGTGEPFRMAVQWVSRPDASFRGYAGRVASGRLRVGDPVVVLPAGRRSSIARIIARKHDLGEAIAGQSVMLTLNDEIDCSRGDVIAAQGVDWRGTGRLDSTLVWMADEPLALNRPYWLKTGAQTVTARVTEVRSVLDVASAGERGGAMLELNDIGRVAVDLDRPIATVPYAQNRKLGAFILIDKFSNATVAAGMIDRISEARGRLVLEHRSKVRWVTGPRRSVWAARAAERLRSEGHRVAILDHDAVAAFGTSDLIRTAEQAARLLAASNAIVLVTLGCAPDGALPGERIDSETDPDGAEQWVI